MGSDSAAQLRLRVSARTIETAKGGDEEIPTHNGRQENLRI